MIGDRQRGDVKVMTLPRPLSVGETLKICAFDDDVMIEGCGETHELRKGEVAAYAVVVIDDGLPTEDRRWERRLP